MRRLGVLGMLLVGAAAVAAPASAAVVLHFDRTVAKPGERVSVHTATALFARSGPRKVGIRVYLVPLEAAGIGLFPGPQASWVPVGELRRDRRGVGRLRFVVPSVHPGKYTTAVWCRTCLRPPGSFFVAGALLGSPASLRASTLRVTR